ncbi:uncharacterized protein LOC108911431 [Anoplophora glabripennis]|uniref:uncharacterized protein LOC108911431 n=1 Tax=Anoplophora glabripennis TaxID=217634 RepID=UPI000874F4D2|nr:uncharacterized protein LOC108911431 [Anoplophora glabripennis]
MYFSVKYIDLNTFEETKDVDAYNISDLTDDAKRAINVQNKELIVNPDCFIAIIIDYVFAAVGIGDDIRTKFDIITSQGKPLTVHSYPPTSSGLNIFIDGEQYYVAFCDMGVTKPLLSKTSQEYFDLIEGRKRKVKTKKSKSSITRSSKESATHLHRLNSARTVKGSPSRAKGIVE